MGQLRITSTERRLVFTFCYYVIVGIFLLVFCNHVLDNWHRLLTTYEKYFTCQYNPHLSLECAYLQKKADKFSLPVYFTISALTLGAVPVVTLSFVINIKCIMVYVSKCIHKIHDLIKTRHAHHVLEFVS